MRSANTPPTKVNTKPGAVAMKRSTPNQEALDICSTSQPCATACIHVPVFERKAPDQKRRKLRCRSARNMSLSPRLRSGVVFSSADITNLNNIATALKQNRKSDFAVIHFDLRFWHAFA